MSLIASLIEQLEAAVDRVAAMETRLASMIAVGPVEERDKDKGIRLRIGGTDDEPMLSPWIKPPDHSGVTSYLPDKGQQYMAIAAGGDHEQAGLIPLTHSKEKPNPAADEKDTVFYNRNGVRFSEKDGVVTIKAKTVFLDADGAKAQLTSEGWKHLGGKVEHDDKNIGKTHRHGEVEPGGGKSGPPDE